MISVVIPNYRRKDCVITLLHDVYAQTGLPEIPEVIVVDDCSGDGSVEEIAARFPQARVIPSATNGGPSVARNRGIRAASGTIIIGLDSDVTLPDRTLFARILAALAASPDIGGVALRVLAPDGVTDDGPRWCHPLPIAGNADRAFLTSYFSGTGYVFRRQPLLDAGLFPETFFMDYEEVELALRILDLGTSLAHFPDLCVVHHENRESRRGQAETYFRPRNQILFAASTLPLHHAALFILTRTPFQGIKALRQGYLRNYLRALRDAARKLPAEIRRRKPLRLATMRDVARLRRGVFFTPPRPVLG